jgi:hypothetical protein
MGGNRTPELAEVTSLTAAAIPGARVHVLAGHGHVAHVSEPGIVAEVLRIGSNNPIGRSGLRPIAAKNQH